MIVHSDAIGSMVFFFVMAISALTLVVALMALAGREFRFAGKILKWWSVCVVAYTALTIAVSLLLPQKIVNPGQSYCVDIWCIGVQRVTKTPLGQDVVYRTDVRIFSDADNVKISAKGASLFLVDERGRRFPMVPDPAVTPFDTELGPKQAVDTTLTFRVAADAQHLALRGEGPSLWITKFFIGDDSAWLHRPTLIRVL
jgi:hypothetical protein